MRGWGGWGRGGWGWGGCGRVGKGERVGKGRVRCAVCQSSQ